MHLAGGDLLLKCSYKHIPLKLSRAADIFNVGGKLSFPYHLLSHSNLGLNLTSTTYPYLPEPEMVLDQYLLLYAKNDIKITVEILKKFFYSLKKNNITYLSRHNSISSIAVSHCLKTAKRSFVHLKPAYDAAIRPAYYGGRCEVFGNKRPGEKILHYDFRGMYQRSMLGCMPVGN